jgi:hypothetical protein
MGQKGLVVNAEFFKKIAVSLHHPGGIVVHQQYYRIRVETPEVLRTSGVFLHDADP